MSKIISIMSGKGGAGKTTTAINLAAALSAKHRVIVADHDAQRSAINWFADRLAPFPIKAASLQQIESLPNNSRVSEFAYVIIDSPAGITEEAAMIIAGVSDLVVIPSKCSFLDIEPALSMARTLRLVGVERRLLLTQVPVSAKKSVNTVKRMLHQRDVPFFGSVIRLLEAHVKATLEHKTVFDMGYPARAARLDYSQFAKEVEQKLAHMASTSATPKNEPFKLLHEQQV